MESIYIKKAIEASNKVFELYVAASCFMIYDSFNITGVSSLKNDVLNSLKEAINKEREVYDKIPDDDIRDYVADNPELPEKITPFEYRPFFRLSLKNEMLEYPDLVYNGHSLNDIMKAKELIDNLKDTIECNQASLRNGDISSDEFIKLEASRLLMMAIFLSMSPLAEEFAINVNFDISKLNRFTFKDIDDELGTSFSSSMDGYSHASLVHLKALIEVLENYKPDDTSMYLGATTLTLLISRFGSVIADLELEDLNTLGLMLDNVNDNTKKNPAYMKIKEFYNKRKREFM